MLSFIDYEKKSNPIILGLCRSNSPIIAQLLSLKNGRFLVPQSVALMDRPAAVNTDDFLRDHAVVLSDKHTDGKKGTQQQQQQQQQRQLFLSLNGVFGTYDEAETQILTVMGRVAISSPDIFFKSSQNVERFFEANSSVLAKEDVTTGAQATIVLLREDTLKRANGTDLPFTLISEFVDSKSYQLIQLNVAEPNFDAKSPSPSLSGGGGNKQITTANLIDFGTDVSSPSPLIGVVGNADATRPETPVEGRVEEGEGRENFLLGTNYEADAEGKDDFFVNVFARDKLFTEQVRPRLDEFIQKFVTDHAVCRSADGKAVQDEISQVKATLVLNSGFASNEAQNASIICGLENYLMSNLHKV